MDVIVQHLENCPLDVLDHVHAHQKGGSTEIFCEIINRATEPLYAKAFAVGRDQLARCVAVDEVLLGELRPDERRQVHLNLTPSDGGTIVGVYVVAFRTLPGCQGTVPRQPEARDEGGDE